MTARTTDSRPSTSPPIAKQQLVENLRNQIQNVATSNRVSDGTVFSSGCGVIDQLLPGGGYSRGTLVQWFNPPSHKTNRGNPLPGGHGAEWLSLLAAKNACQDGQAMVIVDPDHTFNPPAAAALGVELSSLIILRPPKPHFNHHSKDLLWAIDQALRCSAVGAVWGMVGDVDPRWLRRFQLSAEQSGVVGFLIRPGYCVSAPSWAEIDWQITPPPILNKPLSSPLPHSAFLLHLHLLRAPHGHAGQNLTIQINTITGSVHEAQINHATSPLPLAPQLAYPASGRRAATA